MINCILVFCFTTDQPSRYLQIVLKKFFDLNLMPEPPSERFERTAYNVYNVYLQLSVVLNNFFQMNFKRFFALFHFVVPLLLLLLDKIILQNHFYPNWTSLVGRDEKDKFYSNQFLRPFFNSNRFNLVNSTLKVFTG